MNQERRGKKPSDLLSGFILHPSSFILHPSGAAMSDESSDRQRCKNLNCKSMVVYGEAFASDPDYIAGATEFWCESTSKGQGPDGDGVSLEECSEPTRACYREY